MRNNYDEESGLKYSMNNNEAAENNHDGKSHQ